ncbi:hypothetical protein [Sedimentitalea todarodis]|uniref:Glycosyltransferase RgtA/B/C/D-like domain-containing protein n=1 Tax=Sedimentitalea todarodis TaxID=1631240 RepID=A0ABU3VHA1_9RHOB|nr:hypothetical protein [Sedimentitalea todarodis]MDU9005547.1 hypothetical protein [Sedimentitalea todarodis]
MRTLYDLIVAILCTAILAVFTWIILDPRVGFDDANITQNYAQNIANGLGYVYYAGGERVEGSTSALWTAVNALGFLITGAPEALLASVGFGCTVGMIFFTILIARRLVVMAGLESRYTAIFVALLYACFPALFGWTVWSLMETGLWCFLGAGFLWASVRLLQTRNRSASQADGAALILFAVLMVLTRPEAILLVSGAVLVLFLIDRTLPGPRATGLLLLTTGAGIATFLALTAARTFYFGVPHPNTYYAKVSTDRIAEIKAGARYTLDYIGQPDTLILFALAALGPLAVLRLASAPERRALISVGVFASAVGIGTVAVYTVLGGDHFGSHRYYQIFLVLLVPSTVLGILWLSTKFGRTLQGFALVVSAALVLQWAAFAADKGDYEIEFRLAEDARAAGTVLNQFGDERSVAVYIAGGIAMTYDGPIYDMLGLNWSEMAHADRGRRGSYGAFSKPVFYQALPQVVNPQLDACAADWADNPNVIKAFDNLFQEAHFRELYVLDCLDGVSFFRLRSLG